MARSDDDWAIAEGEDEGGLRLLLRYNRTAAELDQSAWPVRLELAVPFLDAREDGFYGEREGDALERIEDALEAYLDADEHGVLVFAVTTAGARDYVAYVSDEATARGAEEAARGAASDHEVLCSVADEPSWETYRETVASVEGGVLG